LSRSPAPQGTILNNRRASISSGVEKEDDKSEDEGEDQTHDQERVPSLPFAVKSLPPLKDAYVPQDPMKSTKGQIISLLGGGKFANHIWKVKTPKEGLGRQVKVYGLLDSNVHIYAPSRPGQHGATISNYMIASVDLTEDFPLFVKDGNGSDLYTYFGQYVEPRFSDVIGYNEMAAVLPKKILRWHARELCEKAAGAKRITAIEALKDQWPKKILGWVNVETERFTETGNDGEPVFVPISDEEADAITEEDIMAAFERVSIRLLTISDYFERTLTIA